MDWKSNLISLSRLRPQFSITYSLFNRVQTESYKMDVMISYCLCWMNGKMEHRHRLWMIHNGIRWLIMRRLNTVSEQDYSIRSHIWIDGMKYYESLSNRQCELVFYLRTSVILLNSCGHWVVWSVISVSLNSLKILNGIWIELWFSNCIYQQVVLF